MQSRIISKCLLILLLGLLPFSRLQGQTQVQRGAYCSGVHVTDVVSLPGLTFTIDTVFYNVNTGQAQIYNVSIGGVYNYLYTIYPSYDVTESVDECDRYTWNVGAVTRNYTASATDAITLQSVDGCDSIRRLNLTIRRSTAATQTETACDRFVWTTSDPDVNGHTSHGTYTASSSGDQIVLENAAGCDSTVTLNLTVRYNSNAAYSDSVCKTGFTGSYTWNEGKGYSETYSQPTDGSLVEYLVSYTNSYNCPSVDTLRLALFRNDTLVEPAQVRCDSIWWHGVKYTSGGDKEYVSHDVVGGVCDSVYQLSLSIYSDSAADMEHQTLAGAATYSWRGRDYAIPAGDTVLCDTVLNAVQGVCDSMFSVMVSNYAVVTFDTMFCDGYRFTPRGGGAPFDVTADTSVRDTLSATIDTIFIWNIDIQPSYASVIETVNLCDSARWYADGYVEDYNSDPASNHTGDSLYVASTAMPTVTLKTFSSNGLCDSVVTVNLTVYPSYTDTLTTPVEDLGAHCGTYTWHGIVYSETTDPACFMDASVHGCDSLVAMKVTLRPTGDSIRVVEDCGSYEWQPVGLPPVIFTADTLHTIAVLPGQAANGCDSLLLLQVYVYPTYDTTYTVTACDHFQWVNVNHPTQDADGNPVSDSLYRADATLGPVTYNTHPRVSEHCDSIVTIQLTVLPNDTIADTATSCYPYRFGDSTYSVTTVVYDTLPGLAANGCAVIGAHHIVIYNPVSRYDTVDACYSYTWLSHRHTLTTDTVGYFATVHGCDSNVYMHIIIHDSTSTTETLTTCGDTTWHGIYLAEAVGSTVSYDTVAYHLTDVYGCDSTAHIHLTVKSQAYDTVALNPCDRYTWRDGNAYTSDTVVSYRSPGIAANGCDSITYLELSIKYSTYRQLDTAVCESFVWQTTVPDTSGATFHGEFTASNNTAQVFLVNAAGCDSVITLNLTVNHNNTGEDSLVVCDSVLWNGLWYSASGDYTTTLPGANIYSCDSTVTLHLTVNNSSATVDSVEYCDSYTWPMNGATYAHSTQVPQVRLTNRFGCDSTVTLHLTLHSSDRNAVDAVSACDSLVWHGATYAGNTQSPTFDTLTVHGCDSTVTLHLNIRHSTAGTLDTAVCDSVLWHTGVWYTASTIFPDTLTGRNGCDSVNRVRLTVVTPVVTDIHESACDTYTWTHNGATYTLTGDYRDTVSSSTGCDSVIVLHLTIHHSDTVSNIYNTETRHECNNYVWNGSTYWQTGIYQWRTTDIHGCDSVTWLNLTITPSGRDTLYQAACNSYDWDGTVYTADTLFVYDSTVNATCNIYHWIDIHIARDTATTEMQMACNAYEWTDGVNFRYYYTEDTVASITLHRPYSGCDSTVTLNLTVNHPTVGYDSVSACDSYYGTPLQRTFTASFDSVINLTALNGTRNRYGCDSLLHQVVNIRRSSYHRVDTVVCQGITWNGRYYTSDIYGPVQARVNDEGCRHLDTLNLTVHHPDTAATDILSGCDSLFWHGGWYTASGIYYHTVDSVANGVCDSVYVLNLTLYATQHDMLADGACYSYQWARNGQSYTNPGLYSHIRPSVAAGGCDSVYWLSLSIYGDESEQIYNASCDSLTWHGTTYTATGTYRYNTQSSHGCDSVVWLNLTIHHADTASAHLYETVCGNYIWKGADYRQSGIYRYDTLTVNGCDSTVWLHLTVNSYDTIDTAVVRDANTRNCDSYTWTVDGRVHHYTASGTYFDTVVPNVSLCGQLHRLDLTILQSTADTVVRPQCGSWTYNGVLYTSDTIIERGRDVGGNAAGCDSVHYLHIVINTPVTTYDTHDVCDSLLWIDGNTYTASNYTAVYEVPGGSVLTQCDSTVVLQLTVRNSSVKADTLVGCDRRYWSLVGRTYYADIDTTVNYTALTGVANAAGCDSLIAMHISVPSSSNTVDSVVSCGPYRWSNGVRYLSSIDGPVYLDRNRYGCDSTVTLHLEVYQHVSRYEVDTVCDSAVWHGTAYFTNGFYIDQHSNAVHGVCDSTYYLDLTVFNTHRAPVESVVARDYYLWPRTNRWYTVSGQYTETVTDAVNGHCDSVYTLNLEIYSDSVSTVSHTDCSRYTWRGRTYTTSGRYADTVYNAVHGVADSIYILDLVLHYPDTVAWNATACNEYVWTSDAAVWAPDTLTVSNTYYHYDRNAVGGVCDRVYKLNLTIQHTYIDSTAVTACGGYDWRNHHYTVSGNYSETVRRNAVNACDSVFKLHLTVNREYSVVDNQQVCDAYYWAPSNRTFTSDTSFVDTLYTVNHCDSIVTLNLNVFYSSDRVSHRYPVACGHYTWPLTGRTYTASTTDTYSWSDGQVCDSSIMLHLTVYPVSTTVIRDSGCVAYTWRGHEYTASGSYFDTLLTGHGCDSILNLQLSVYRHHRDAVYHDTACDSYTWHGRTYTSSTTSPTFDTLTLHGCDSTVRLSLTVYNSRRVVAPHVACDRFTWIDGITYTTSTQTPVYHTVTSHGCDSAVTLHLTVNRSTSSVFDTAVCASLTWVDGQTYTATTDTPTYRYAAGNAVGCDSTVTLHLTVNNNGSTVDLADCDSLLWNGTVYRVSDTAVEHYVNAAGCDSVVTYNLQVNHSVTTHEAVTACDSLVWHGITYTYSPDNATYLTQTEQGCDSIVVLDLTLNRSNTALFSQTACDSYTWHGTTYTSGTELGDASYVSLNAAGCDSTTWLLLTLNRSVTTSITDRGVDVYTWNGVDYTASGTYSQTLTATNGCDSVVTLQLVMIDFPLPQILVHGDRLLMVNHYPEGEGTAQVNYIAYRWYRNNTLIPGATNDYYNSSNYATLQGCYYVEVPVDASRSMWVSSNTICIGVGVDEVHGADADFSVYPNPVVSGDRMTVRATVSHATLTVYDLQGRQVMRRSMDSDQTSFLADFPAGVYTLRLETTDGRTVAKKLIVR
ncbi:MAG: Uncharacterized protein AUK63_126 [bacterium P3]|nr:MAG: Uncharacterized protein AUK63_126 [bacterium P3]